MCESQARPAQPISWASAVAQLSRLPAASAPRPALYGEQRGSTDVVDLERRMLDPETLIEQMLKVAPDGVTVVAWEARLDAP
jgi:hypothetical protein